MKYKCKECYLEDGEDYTDCEHVYTCPQEKTKEEYIDYSIEKIKDILQFLRPEKSWEIKYIRLKLPAEVFDEWTITYHGLIANEEYILIYDDEQMNHLLYAINVTGDSVLCALSELMQLLVNKF